MLANFVILKVGIRCLETGVSGAYYNVIINAEGIKDEKYKNGVSSHPFFVDIYLFVILFLLGG